MKDMISVRELKNILQKYRDDDTVMLGIRCHGAEAELYVVRGTDERTYREFPIMKTKYDSFW